MKRFITFTLLLATTSVLAGGRNDQVKFPVDYKDTFTHYNSQNRGNNKQVADMFANDIASNSVKNGELADGSIIVMEIHKPEVDGSGAPVVGKDGLFVKAELAAIAVMEKRNDWGADYPADERAGGWGFALYDTQGAPKQNDLDCATCHRPLTNTDFMFSFSSLSGLN